MFTLTSVMHNHAIVSQGTIKLQVYNIDCIDVNEYAELPVVKIESNLATSVSIEPHLGKLTPILTLVLMFFLSRCCLKSPFRFLGDLF